MVTQVFARNIHLYDEIRTQNPVLNPLLKALEHINYGRLKISALGKTLIFEGKEKGPEAQLWLSDWKALDSVMLRGDIGFAEDYIRGRWTTNDLPALITFFLMNSSVLEKFFHVRYLHYFGLVIRNLLRMNTRRGSRRNIVAHYDLGNEFYKLWLDKSMTYSCALFNGNHDISLEDAQKAKYRRIIDKLALEPYSRILEIGCGWGGFAEVAARKRYRVDCITISDEQVKYARERLHNEVMANRVKVELLDYRDVKGTYDGIVSIGMFEHVGERFWPVYFKAVKRLLRRGGKAMIQTITIDDELFSKYRKQKSFIKEYIFPGGLLPSKTVFHDCAEKAGLECREFFTFGQDYALTLRNWLERFDLQSGKIRSMGFSENFIRMWRFYLSGCIASFIVGRTDVMQAELINN